MARESAHELQLDWDDDAPALEHPSTRIAGVVVRLDHITLDAPIPRTRALDETLERAVEDLVSAADFIDGACSRGNCDEQGERHVNVTGPFSQIVRARWYCERHANEIEAHR